MKTSNFKHTANSTSKKNDLNFNKSSILYFQIGLIICLLMVYFALEYSINSTNNPEINLAKVTEDNFELPAEPFKIYKEPVAENPKPKPNKSRALTISVNTIDNNAMGESIIDNQPSDRNKELEPGDIHVVLPPEDISIIMVEKVPVFPGCEHLQTNEEQRKCLSDKIHKIIQKNFNTNLAQDYGLIGKQVIGVQFKIDSKGHVVEIETRAPHPALGKEAERVLNKVPEMTPGKHNGKPVNVKYALPIKFVIN
jgi:protein TonB